LEATIIMSYECKLLYPPNGDASALSRGQLDWLSNFYKIVERKLGFGYKKGSLYFSEIRVS